MLRKLILLITFLLFGLLSKANQCLYLFEDKTSIVSELREVLNQALLMDRNAIENELPSVTVTEITDDEIKIKKHKGHRWYSSARLLPEQPFSNQGDVLNPIYVFGVKLSAQLGFRIETTATGEIILVAPSAKTLKKKIKILNAKLKALEQEEIGFQPISIGYLSSRQLLKLSIGGPDGIEFQFPFSDKDLRTLPHEISFHLIAMLLPKPVLQRTKAVTKRNLELAEMLRNPKYNLGSWGKSVADQIEHDRNLDLDLGSANFATDLARYRKLSKFQDYGAEAGIQYANERNMISDMLLLARSNTLPSLAAVERLVRMTSLDIYSPGLNKLSLQGGFFHPLESLTRANVLSQAEKKFEVLGTDLPKIERLIKDFLLLNLAQDREQFATYEDPSSLSVDFMKNVDARIELFVKILSEGVLP